MIAALRFSILAGLIAVSGAATSKPTSIAALASDAYPACNAARMAGADLTTFKRVIAKAAKPISSTEAADRFFIVNEVLVAPAKLRRGRRDIIAYVRGPSFCGTSGCAAFVIEQLNAPAAQRPQYRMLTKILPARLPISALTTTHNGARDIGVAVEGGGIRNGYTGALVFDGRSYASNPTLPGVRHVKATAGHIVLGAPNASTHQCQLR
jgi:hypothetical protein